MVWAICWAATWSLVPAAAVRAQDQLSPAAQPWPQPEPLWDAAGGSGAFAEGPLWVASADLLLLDRSGPGSQSLILQQVGGIELLNANQMAFDVALGPRLSLLRDSGVWDVEIVHFNVTGWHESASQNAPPTIVYPGSDEPNDGFIKFSGEMQFTAEARLFSTELNVGCDVWPMVRLLAGFRWIEFRDAIRGEAIDPGFPAYVFTDNNVDNHLYGGQLGLDVLVADTGGLRLNTVLKAGLFGNAADTSTAMSDGFFLEQVEGTSASFVGEVLVVGDYRLSPTWSLRAGLQLLWISDVGLAPEQLDHTHAVGPPESQIDLTGSLFAAGLLVGLEARY